MTDPTPEILDVAVRERLEAAKRFLEPLTHQLEDYIWLPVSKAIAQVDMALDLIDDALRAAGPEQPDHAPVAGWKMVPVEPTREMWAAAGDAVVNLRSLHPDALSEAVWKAMLRAAPPPDLPVALSEQEGGA